MTRAQPLSRDERRQAIIDATLPLVLQQGREVSTRQIAEAAGIAEGTLFRVFDSKAAILDAAIAAGLAPTLLTEELGALAPTASVSEAVTQIVTVLVGHARRSHLLFGLRPPHDPCEERGASGHHDAHRAAGERTMDAIAAILQPHADALSLSPRSAAGPILALSFGSTFAASSPEPSRITDVILHGISAHESH